MPVLISFSKGQLIEAVLLAAGKTRMRLAAPGYSDVIELELKYGQWTTEQRNKLREAFFYDELVPRRTAMLQIADRIGLVNERSLTRAEYRFAEASDRLRRTLLLTFSFTLLGGLGLALVTTFYTLRLERRLEQGLEDRLLGAAW